MSIPTALNWLLFSSILLRWGITAIPQIRRSYWIPVAWSAFLIVWLVTSEATIDTYPLRGYSTIYPQCLPPVDGAIAGIGGRISLYVHVFYIFLQWLIGLFSSRSVGACSLSGGLLFVNIAFTIAVLTQYAIGVLTFTDAIIGILVLEIQSNGLLLLLGTHEVRCKRWLMAGLFSGVVLSFGTMALFVGSATSLYVGKCNYAEGWIFDRIDSSSGRPAYGFWMYFVSKCISTACIAWEACCDARPPRHLSSTSVLEFVVPMFMATVLVEKSAEVAATMDYLSETGQVMNIAIAGVVIVHAVWTTARAEPWGLLRFGKMRGGNKEEYIEGVKEVRISQEDTLNELSMMETSAGSDVRRVVEQQFV